MLLYFSFKILAFCLIWFFFHILTVRHNGFPEAPHPLGHWVEVKYDESGKFIPAPRGTFPHFEEMHKRFEEGKRLPKRYWKTWLKICTWMGEIEVRISSRNFPLFRLSRLQPHFYTFENIFQDTLDNEKDFDDGYVQEHLQSVQRMMVENVNLEELSRLARED